MPLSSTNLKQRLSNLSLATSAPSSPTPNGSFPSWPLRGDRSKQLLTKLTPPWAKRPQSPLTHDYDDWERVQDVMTKLIFQAGVDFETRPMVVVNASALPDPDEVNYDLLLSRILAYLNLYVESDYTVVFFAAGGGHTPAWNWVWKTYRSLSRKYRKNLKQLYVVHSSFFAKMLFSLAGAIISPKFFRKIIHISTLSELAHHVPLTQIDIPPSVYQENLKYENKITLPIPIRSSVFGAPLEELMGYHGEKGGIPRVVKDSIQFLRDSGMEEEGLFRRSPSSAMLRAAQDAYDRGNVVSLTNFGDPFLAAVLIKKYLRDLPDPIFPERLYPVIRRCPPPTASPSDMTAITYMRDTLFPELVPCAYILLSNILHLMHDISLRSTINKMDAHNLSIVLCPNLVKSSNPIRDVQMCAISGGPSILASNAATGPGSAQSILARGQSPEDRDKTTLGMVIKLCIQRYYEVFDDVLDRSEIVSPSRVRTLNGQDQGQNSGSPSPMPTPNPRPILPTHLTVVEGEDEGDEDIDDTMLVMPIEPAKEESPISPSSASSTSRSQFQRTQYSNGLSNNVSLSSLSSSSVARSVHTGSVSGTGSNTPLYPTLGKAKSVISVEGAGNGTVRSGKKGSISVGRGTTRKSVGSGVEAMGVTAEGFFAPLNGTSPTNGNGRRGSRDGAS
ncbi:Rho GTPase-activating protein 8 [Leucoagaricus sp. SymC.cos]|nr:Rho GTPase-activating protein 8 [Leucoagaricus sp. SymC.cos]